MAGKIPAVSTGSQMARKASEFKIIGRGDATLAASVPGDRSAASLATGVTPQALNLSTDFSRCDVSHFNLDERGAMFGDRQKEVVMTRQFNRDPTEFFSVVGAPYVRDTPGMSGSSMSAGTGDQRPRLFEIGVASLCAAFCAVSLGVSLFANNGAARLVQVAYQAVR